MEASLHRLLQWAQISQPTPIPGWQLQRNTITELKLTHSQSTRLPRIRRVQQPNRSRHRLQGRLRLIPWATTQSPLTASAFSRPNQSVCVALRLSQEMPVAVSLINRIECNRLSSERLLAFAREMDFHFGKRSVIPIVRSWRFRRR